MLLFVVLLGCLVVVAVVVDVVGVCPFVFMHCMFLSVLIVILCIRVVLHASRLGSAWPTPGLSLAAGRLESW